MEFFTKNKTTIIIILVIIVLLFGVYFYGKAADPKQVKVKPVDVKNDVAKGFDPNAAAESIHRAITNSFTLGIGADKMAVENVLYNRNNTELKLIYNAYRALYDVDLIEDLDSEWITDFSNEIALLRTAINS